MKANELRIGNYLYNRDGIIFQATTISKYNDLGLDQRFCKPIPLTEEWLLKFGFNTDSDCWYYYLDWSKQHETFKIAKDEFNNYFLVGQYSKAFKHVHQLQNLYFALTNEELTIK